MTQATKNIDGGVLWITGYSGAGKTTIGRKVESLLRQRDFTTVFLDGDDLRRIFSGRWGYERADRMELAKVYFHLCSHLASQGITVVISAIAMYAEVYEWVAQNISRATQVYLRVPEEERLRRDRAGKRIYDSFSVGAVGYDEPHTANLVIDNFGDADPDKVAQKIVELYLAGTKVPGDLADHGKRAHWEGAYRTDDVVAEPSPFAIYAAKTLPTTGSRLLEVGCGSGRDSVYFNNMGLEVCAVDASRSAIELCRRKFGHLPIEFHHGTIGDYGKLRPSARFDTVYCRFVIHAMTRQEEMQLLLDAYEHLEEGGQLLIECRSVNDPMLRLGEVISPTERIHGHYRRFIVMEELLRNIGSVGFTIESAIESSGLAVYKGEDPVVIRLAARK